MRIEELSIGDWVEVEARPYKIIGIEKWRPDYVTILENVNGIETLGKECLSPIPLTPEILEKNGLCVVEEDADFREYELFGSENFSIFHTKGTLHYRLETPQASVVCWNVHQLQHALRLAGVEKEIKA
jgi:hypothetical protein